MTLKQLRFILINIIAIIQTGFLSSYKQWFYTVGVDVYSLLNRRSIPFTILEKYFAISGNKRWKVNRIMELYQRACDIVDLQDISRFYYEFQGEHRTIHIDLDVKR